MKFPGLLTFDSNFFKTENESHIYPNMCAKFGCGPTVLSKKKGGGTDRQRETAALYSRLAGYPASLGREGGGVRRGWEARDGGSKGGRELRSGPSLQPSLTGKGSFYIAQYPVRWTAQSALHFLPSLADLFIPTPTRLLREAF